MIIIIQITKIIFFIINYLITFELVYTLNLRCEAHFE